MQDPKDLIQEKLVTKPENPSPEYQRLIKEYTADPLYDLTVKPDEKKPVEPADVSPLKT